MGEEMGSSSVAPARIDDKPAISDNSHKKPLSPARHPSVDTLAPLEYLQNQRRGSITDPSLHAAASPRLQPTNPTSHNNLSSSSSETPSPELKSRNTNINEPRPASPYVFGDASVSRRPEASQGIHEGSWRQSMSGQSEYSATEGSSKPKDANENMDVDRTDGQQVSPTGSALGQGNLGTKRKMSDDREITTDGGDIDPQLVGPGMSVDAEGPAPKRRGSAFDTQRIAQMSLNDRRYSVDSRLPGVSGGEQNQWWNQDRRDSAPNVFSNATVGYAPPGFSADPHGRPPGGMATFAWPATTQPEQAASSGGPNLNDPNSNMSGPPRPYDPSVPPPPLAMNYSVTFASERRMSVPDMTPPGPTTQRVLRSRSRPPSRARGEQSNDQGQSPTSSTEQQPDSAGGTPSNSGKKDTTPYSRSPELRVSHKLAERKRRREMKDLFDELRDQLPADRGMKASKWEILSKAIDFIVQLKHGHQEMGREIEMLRHEVDGMRSGMPPFASGGPPPVVYGQGPPVVHGHYAAPPVPHPSHPTHPPQQPQPPLSRPNSSQNMYAPGAGPPGQPSQNGHVTAVNGGEPSS